VNTSAALRRIFIRLNRAFGPQHWWPGNSQLEVAVGAILTQNTAWTNVERAILRLKRRQLLSLSSLARLAPQQLAPLIRSSGCYNVKAERLHTFLGWLRQRGGFDGIARVPTPQLRRDLLALPGIGPETGDSILLYTCNRPVFVIDAYTRRILGRYGLIRGDEPYGELQALFHDGLPRSVRLFNEYHALLVRLAKTHCRARPACSACPLTL
jgi:endonuclease-3 related protein